MCLVLLILPICVVCINGWWRYVCCSECYVVSNELWWPPPLPCATYRCAWWWSYQLSQFFALGVSFVSWIVMIYGSGPRNCLQSHSNVSLGHNFLIVKCIISILHASYRAHQILQIHIYVSTLRWSITMEKWTLTYWNNAKTMILQCPHAILMISWWFFPLFFIQWTKVTNIFSKIRVEWMECSFK